LPLFFAATAGISSARHGEGMRGKLRILGLARLISPVWKKIKWRFGRIWSDLLGFGWIRVDFGLIGFRVAPDQYYALLSSIMTTIEHFCKEKQEIFEGSSLFLVGKCQEADSRGGAETRRSRRKHIRG